MNVAMFGGSFNPVHNAHVNFAKKVIEAVNLQKLYIMPTYSSPHKTGEGMALPEDRFNMCNIAFKEIKKEIMFADKTISLCAHPVLRSNWSLNFVSPVPNYKSQPSPMELSDINIT